MIFLFIFQWQHVQFLHMLKMRPEKGVTIYNPRRQPGECAARDDTAPQGVLQNALMPAW